MHDKRQSLHYLVGGRMPPTVPSKSPTPGASLELGRGRAWAHDTLITHFFHHLRGVPGFGLKHARSLLCKANTTATCPDCCAIVCHTYVDEYHRSRLGPAEGFLRLAAQ
ncbi:hypothetical protein PAPYR_8661 [Paratrimastix pyriformis]|uniref:Uncharacterized protein n=1 Tax=Paratrimastix pyriformis TaxID=342808 RepID=A0ABQ8UBQ1_9EUKA|nr:hypothetical protein PAPYR_8661 [Paratrimastix pyriformis]